MAAIEKRGRHDANSPAVKLVSLEKRALIVKLRRNGWTLHEIKDHPDVGLASHSTVQFHLDAHLAEQRPSAAVTEELRQMQAASLDGLQRSLYDQLDDELTVMESLAVRDRILKVHERRAKLFGLDMQQGIALVPITREALAAALGRVEPLVIEGTAVEEVIDGE